MKKLLVLATVAIVSLSQQAGAADVGVSVSIGEPGFYGRIDIGHFPPPPIVYAEPIIVQPAPVAILTQPVYLHVPPGHMKNWSKHCHRYGACGQRVFFVQDSWYNDVYVPARHERHGKHRPKSHAHHHHHDHGHKGKHRHHHDD